MNSYIFNFVFLSAVVFIAGCGLFILQVIGKQLALFYGTLIGCAACLMTYCVAPKNSTIAGRGLSFIPSLAITIITIGVIAALYGLATYQMRGNANLIA